MASSFEWFGGSGDLDDASNWLDENDPAMVTVPGSTDSVYVNGSGTLTGGVDADYLAFTGTFTANIGIRAATIEIGGPAGSNGNVEFDGTQANLIYSDYLEVGDAGTGVISFIGGFGVWVSDAVSVGVQDGSSGTVTIFGGELNAAAITLGSDVGANGAVTVSGRASQLVASGYLSVGVGGEGALSVTGGATVSSDGVDVAFQPGATGAIAVDGSSSHLTDSSDFGVGSSGNGTVAVTNGADLTTANMDIGVYYGGSGSVTISGQGSSLTDSGSLIIGDAGEGTLSVTNGAGIAGPALIEVAAQSTATGDLTIDEYDHAFTITAGAGAATVTINGNDSSNITGGSGADQVSLDGTGDNSFTAGSGAATLSIDGGGDLTVSGNLSGAQATVADDSTLELGGAFSGALMFSGTAGSVLKLDAPQAFTGTISGFVGGDMIDLTDVASITALSWSAGVLTLSTTGGPLTLALQGGFSPTAFTAFPDGKGGTDIALGPSVTDYLLAAELAYDITLPGYSNNTEAYEASLAADGFQQLSGSSSDPSGMAAEAFINTQTQQIIVAFRGTVFAPFAFSAQTYQDVVQLDAGGIFLTNPLVLQPLFAAAMLFVQGIEQANPGYTLFLSGHSLGGAEAEAVAAALAANPSGFPDTFGGGATFAAPGVSALLGSAPPVVNNLTDYVVTDDPVATYSNGDTVGKANNLGPGTHVGVPVGLSPTPLGSLEGLGAGAALYTVSSVLTDGLLTDALSVVLASKGIDLPLAIFGLPQHFLANYGDALVSAGIISSNPLTVSSSDDPGDLSALFTGIKNLAVSADAAGDAIETGVLDITTSIGTAVVALKETLTTAGTTLFSMVIQSGENVAQQILTMTSSGGVKDQIFLDGTQVNTSDITGGNLAAINVPADGSIIVGVSSATAGDELTITDSPTGVGNISSGGDGAHALDTFDTLNLTPNGILDIGAVGASGTASVSEALNPTPLVDNFDGDGLTDLLIQNTGANAGLVGIGEVTGGQVSFSFPTAFDPSQYSIVATGDFLGDGKSDLLIENIGAFAGLIGLGEVASGQVAFSFPTAVAPGQWSFAGSGDFLGDGKDQVLIDNVGANAGLVGIGELVNGQFAFSFPTALDPAQYKIVGTGDFLGDGKSDILIQNIGGAAGLIGIGEVANGQVSYSFPTAIDPTQWKFVGSGDVLGDGKDQFLIENIGASAGLLGIGEVVNGQVSFTFPAVLAPEWSIVATGDYLGEGHDQLLLENTSTGAIDVGDYTAGQLHLTQISALQASAWAFH